MTFRIANLGRDEAFEGVEVIYYENDEPSASVEVRCDYPPLAIEMLRHAMVAMESRQAMETA